ncbi:MAG: hypothetical protein M1826_000615 [Phylliscum demangeonii]|nr:MAG: hypothetical protein M1826_000615 [Phylliscum demangeonii]
MAPGSCWSSAGTTLVDDRSNVHEAGDDVDDGDSEYRGMLFAYLEGQGTSRPADDKDNDPEYRRTRVAYLEGPGTSRPANDEDDVADKDDDPEYRCTLLAYCALAQSPDLSYFPALCLTTKGGS